MQKLYDKAYSQPRIRRAGILARDLLHASLLPPRLLTAKARMAPDFIVIGAMRCGTTSLYNYLTQHPSIVPSHLKEVHFFDLNYSKGPAWYRAHFPSVLSKYWLNQIRGLPFLTGEATPYYLFHPHAPKRLFQTAPKVKLIVVLRNPVDRAYSHYHHEIRLRKESVAFKDAIRLEEERLGGEVQKMVEDESYHSFNHQHYSYLSRGEYIDQLEAWAKFFPREQTLILTSEQFFAAPERHFKRVTEFLGLPGWEAMEYKKFNYGSYSNIDGDVRKALGQHFRPYNRRLYEFIGADLGWDS